MRKDVGLKLVSLLISVSLWAYVRSIALSNTQRTIEFTLYPTNLDRAAYAMTLKSRTIKVTAEGAPEDIQRLDRYKATQFIAYVDLSNAAPGTSAYRVLLQRDEARDAGITYSRPDRVLVSIEPRETVSKKVFFNPVELPPGYVEGSAEITPDTVTLSGPRSALNQVDRVIAPVNLGNYLVSPGATYTVDVVPWDTSMKRVEDVSVEPSKVKVYPVLVQSQKQKNVPIQLNWKGTLPYGYLLQSHEANPQQVTITGDPNRIRNIEEVQTDPIDLSSITGIREVRVKLRVPTDAKLGRRSPHDIRVKLNVIPDPNLQPAKPKELTPSASDH